MTPLALAVPVGAWAATLSLQRVGGVFVLRTSVAGSNPSGSP